MKRRREIPLCWHFALTVIVVGAWALIIGADAYLSGNWIYR